MRAALRRIAAVLAGFIAASLVMLVVEALNGRVFYPELAKAAEGLTDRDAIGALLATAPTGALLVVIAGWILGSEYSPAPHVVCPTTAIEPRRAECFFSGAAGSSCGRQHP